MSFFEAAHGFGRASCASVVHLCPHPPAGQACLRRACSTLETTRRFCRPQGFYFWRLAPHKRSRCGDGALAVGLNQQWRQSNLNHLRLFFVDARAGFGVRLRILRCGQPCGEDSTCRFFKFDRPSSYRVPAKTTSEPDGVHNCV